MSETEEKDPALIRVEEIKKMNLYEKIQCIMNSINYLQKDDKVSFGNTNYKAISEEKVTLSVRQAMIRFGVVILPVGVVLTKDGSLSTVQAKYKIINVHNPVESEIIESCGQGADSQDKGSGKAMTYAYKYMLLRSFAIPTGDDPDKISSEELTDMENKAAAKKKADEARKKQAEADLKKKTDESGKTDETQAGKEIKPLDYDTMKKRLLEMIKKLGFTDSAAFFDTFSIPMTEAATRQIYTMQKGKTEYIADGIIRFNGLAKEIFGDAGLNIKIKGFFQSMMKVSQITDNSDDKLKGFLQTYADGLE